MSKKVSLVYFGNIFAVNGITHVINLFVKGKQLFDDHDLQFKSIYCLNGQIKVDEIQELAIGINSNGFKSKIKKNILSIASILINDRISLFAWLKAKKRMIDPADKVISNNIQNMNEEYLIFQDLFTAYSFLKRKSHTPNQKTILVLHCQDDPFEQFYSTYFSLKSTRYEHKLKKMQQLVYSNISKVIFLSELAQKNNSNRIGEDKTSFVYNGVNNFQVKQKAIDSKINIVCLGSINGHKGQEILLDAIQHLDSSILQKINLHFIGSGTKESELMRITKKHKLTNVTFHGVRNDVPIILEQMDIMVLPSKSEGMPLAILEGMRQGMYIMATEVGAISEMITSEFGEFISRDSKKLSAQLEKAIKDKSKLEMAKIESRKFYIKNFTLEKMISNYSFHLNNL